MGEDDSLKECCFGLLTWKMGSYIISIFNVIGFFGTAAGTVFSVLNLLGDVNLLYIVMVAAEGCMCVLVFFPRTIAFWKMYKAQDEMETRVSNHKANLVTTVFLVIIMIAQCVGMILYYPEGIFSYLISFAIGIAVFLLIQGYFLFCLGKFAGLYGDITSLKDGFKGVKEGLVESAKNPSKPVIE
jgi:hypothetical protein